MTRTEQKAFVRAYGTHVGGSEGVDVADFVARYESGENIPYACGQSSIMDALGIWHEAIKWAIEQELSK